MALYEHNCRACGFEWLEEHAVEDFDRFREVPCVECESEDTFIALSPTPVHFKGSGWSPQGYDKHRSLRGYRNLKVFDRKDEHDREVRGEAEAAELQRQKRLDRAAKKVFGPDAGVTQEQADKAIKKAGDDRVNQA